MAVDRKSLEKELALERENRIREARKSLWEYCKTESPEFYTNDKYHLRILCDTLQDLYEGKLWNAAKGEPYRKLMINMPPRHGKSRTLINFAKWVFGRDRSNKIITCSYNDDQASDFSRYTRDGIREGKTYPHEICYADIFPETQIKDGNAGFEQWALEEQFFSYKGAGIGGSITGKGCNIAIVDDPVKDAEEAYNQTRLDKIWLWYSGTFLSRLEEGGIEIVNMTRWAKGDICGRLLSDPAEAPEWYVLTMEAMSEEGEMLCPSLLSKRRYMDLKRRADPAIFEANYHQKPVDVKGRLYQTIKTYTDIPRHPDGTAAFEEVKAYVDTADTGSDYLAGIVYGVYKGLAYVLDVLYTKSAMEETEPQTAEMLYKNNVQRVKIESNNGGRGFARNIERILWETFKTRKISVEWFHQNKNKEARILSNATNVQNTILFPDNWKDKWPEFYKAITGHQKEGKNKNDDAADALTGVAEDIAEPNEILFGRA